MLTTFLCNVHRNLKYWILKGSGNNILDVVSKDSNLPPKKIEFRIPLLPKSYVPVLFGKLEGSIFFKATKKVQVRNICGHNFRNARSFRWWIRSSRPEDDDRHDWGSAGARSSCPARPAGGQSLPSRLGRTLPAPLDHHRGPARRLDPARRGPARQGPGRRNGLARRGPARRGPVRRSGPARRDLAEECERGWRSAVLSDFALPDLKE